MLSAAFTKEAQCARRVYWLSWLAAGAFMALAAADRGVASSCIVAGAAAVFALMYAYLRTPYVRLGDRIYAYTIPDSRPDSPDGSNEPPPLPPDCYYGYLTAPKMWWTLALITCVLAFTRVELGLSSATLGLGAFTVGALALAGHVDARARFALARRQWVPLAIIVTASVPLFLAPPIAYVATFWAAGGSFRNRDS
ncbi:hypothetical protein H7J88_24690 [Mycolicibacterium flavescens]|uniref:Transmembrane protein n=1 Tax=Mycolicibacterium flavescens TaxID=1776 RepID=A0A1E3RFW0_MYCFV|nr:hypothetical protein [Mycolicibacterium flavescens]MCV7282838.1 hypothetical protein [Mycolicibacterium flavescens]ODQ88744.1 hypothetical protein BHQ18_17965 [Mycolicibacterium flavescens]